MSPSEIQVGGTYRCVITRGGKQALRTVVEIEDGRVRYRGRAAPASRRGKTSFTALVDFARRAQERIA